MTKKFWIRRGFYIGMMALVAGVLWWQQRPTQAPLELQPCHEALNEIYRTIVPGVGGVMPSADEGNRQMPEGYVYLGYESGDLAPLVVEKFHRHPQDVNGRWPICFLLSNGKVVVWHAKSDDFSLLADELKQLYPESGEEWSKAMQSLAR